MTVANMLKTLIFSAIMLVPCLLWAEPQSFDATVVTPTLELDRPTTAQDSWKLIWDGRIYGLGVSDAMEKSDVAGAQVSADLLKKFSDYLDAEAGLMARVSVGSEHSIYTGNRVQNGIVLDQAIVNL